MVDWEDRRALQLVFLVVLLYSLMYFDLDALLQSVECSTDCHHWNSIPAFHASAECSIRQPHALHASTLPDYCTLGLRHPGASVGVCCLPKVVMGFLPGEGYQQAWVEESLLWIGVQCFVPAGEPTLGQLLRQHSGIIGHFCQPIAEVGVGVEFQSR